MDGATHMQKAENKIKLHSIRGKNLISFFSHYGLPAAPIQCCLKIFQIVSVRFLWILPLKPKAQKPYRICTHRNEEDRMADIKQFIAQLAVFLITPAYCLEVIPRNIAGGMRKIIRTARKIYILYDAFFVYIHQPVPTRHSFLGNADSFHINQPFGRIASAQIEVKECRQTAAFLVE